MENSYINATLNLRKCSLFRGPRKSHFQTSSFEHFFALSRISENLNKISFESKNRFFENQKNHKFFKKNVEANENFCRVAELVDDPRIA